MHGGLEEDFSIAESVVFADIALECDRLMYELLLHVMTESVEAVGALMSFLARSGMEQGERVLEVSSLGNVCDIW